MSVPICLLLGNAGCAFPHSAQRLSHKLAHLSVCDSSSLMLRKTPRKKSSFHNLCLTDSQGLLCHTDAILSPQLAQ